MQSNPSIQSTHPSIQVIHPIPFYLSIMYLFIIYLYSDVLQNYELPPGKAPICFVYSCRLRVTAVPGSVQTLDQCVLCGPMNAWIPMPLLNHWVCREEGPSTWEGHRVLRKVTPSSPHVERQAAVGVRWGNLLSAEVLGGFPEGRSSSQLSWVCWPMLLAHSD